MTGQNNEQPVVVFQGRPTENAEYRILLVGDQLVFEKATDWDRLRAPRFVTTDDGYASLAAFVESYCKGQEDQGLVTKPVGIVWQGSEQGIDYRILLDKQELIYEAASTRDLLGVPQFKEVTDDDSVAEALAIAVGRAFQAAKLAEHDQAISSLTESNHWKCDHAPDHKCHYYSDLGATGRVVRLSNGEDDPLPSYYESERETPDQCIYCGQPDERK